jgi:hypothetical protein
MEEAEVRDMGGAKSRRCTAVAAAAVALCLVVGQALLGGPASAQDPVYQIPTPTPEPTHFQNGPTTTPDQPSSGPKLMRPFPRVRTAGSFSLTRTRFTRVTVRGPRGARVAGSCSPKRCKTVKKGLPRSGFLRLKALQRSYPVKTKITIRVSAPSVIGKYVQITTRRGKPPLRRDRCLKPGIRKAVACGGS